jgi:DNA-binding MarR family transcriptional regulator
LVRHLDKLVDEGLVERRRDDRDRRVLRIYLTAAGRKRLKELGQVQAEVDRELRSLLTEREIDVLGKTLMRIHEHFGHREELSGNQR